ncbi:MAG TPA: hypothetical protein PLG92_09230 [Piscinibacter sp.]|jgi:hypothetical protein|uniref:hypothetical protein n=1 Tax=Piscinibacter sp. TaxID=1903157 RepID=UPI001B6749BD|nr:hypothetical protein [Piscinibacter sp.]MBP5989794.1 hypothetical protein [Piscinibacter sp.]MBP6027051.1 hypothetical protein [Piscinibacter sp.]HNK18542.1 hypothetical protein [Piscinibacter sp.]
MKTHHLVRLLAALGLACAAAGAFAHAGHGLAAADSPMHVLEAEHVLPLLALAAAGYAFVAARARRRRRDEEQRRDAQDQQH